MRQLLTFACPFMLSNLMQTCYNLVDMIVIGQYVGAAGLAAVSTGGEIVHFFVFIAMGFSNAGQILISQYIGLKDGDSVSKTIGCMFTFILSLSVVITALGLLLNSTIMHWLQVPTEAMDQCLAYVTCSTLGYIFIFGYNMVSAILRGMGDSRHPMIFIGIAALLNLVLDLILVSRGMGAFGAALATVIAQGVSFVVSAAFLYSHRTSFNFDISLRSFLPEKRLLKKLVRLGIPLMLQTTAISVSALFVTSLINSYGVVVAAVNGVGMKLTTVAYIVTMALSQAGTTMIGQNFAARKFERVKGIVYRSFLNGLIFTSVLSAIIILWPEQVFSLFDNDPAVLAMSHEFVWVAVILFMAAALRSPSSAFCNGLGFASLNLVMGLIDGVVLRIGLSVLLGTVLGYGIHGYWYGSAVAGSAFFFIAFPYFLSGKWKKRKPPVSI